MNNQDQQSLEFDIDAILENNPNPLSQAPSAQPPLPMPNRQGGDPPHGTMFPDLITAINVDDQQTISTLDRDQSLLTRDDPPLAMFRPSFDPDRFADEEAPSLPKFSYKQRIWNNTSDEAMKKLMNGAANNETRDPSLGGSGAGSSASNQSVSFRHLYIIVLIMSLLLLAIITGLAIWLIALRSNEAFEGTNAASVDSVVTEQDQSNSEWVQTSASPSLRITMAPTPIRVITDAPTVAPTRTRVNTAVPTAAPTQSKATPRPTPIRTPPPTTKQPVATAPPTNPPTARPPPTPIPTIPPTPFPTPLPTSESVEVQQARVRFLRILEERSISSISTLGRLDTAHFQAFDWLIHDPNFTTYNDERLLQRWVLATFALGLQDANSGGGDDVSSTLELPHGSSGNPKNRWPVPQALESWVQYTDECSWFYTQRDQQTLCNSQGLYVRIDLRSQNLSGTIPSEIGLLSNHLEFIFLFDNELHGTLPTQLGQLSKLERLEITRNNLEGTVPTEIGKLRELVFLGLGVNTFWGPLPRTMGNLVKLRTIGLERNQFTSEIPVEFGNMVETRILNLDRNQLTGSVPSSLENLTLLSGLNLSFNRDLVGRIPDPICQLQQGQLTYLQADCDNVDCPCCTTCHYHN